MNDSKESSGGGNPSNSASQHSEDGKKTGLSWSRMGCGATLAILAVLFAIVFVHEYRGFMEAWRRADCSAPLKQFGILCRMYAGEDKDRLYPPMSTKPGLLMLAPESIVPRYMDPGLLLACPTMQVEHKLRGYPEMVIDDQCFFYLGYAVTGEADMAAFCAAYKEHIAQDIPLNADLKVPAGLGNLGGDTIYRLRDGIEMMFAAGLANPVAASVLQTTIPVVVERPENHGTEGGNVLFLDGHVEFIRYPGQWPMTAQTINALKELDAMGK